MNFGVCKINLKLFFGKDENKKENCKISFFKLMSFPKFLNLIFGQVLDP